MLRLTTLLIIATLICGSALLIGCDTSAERELQRAEKALDEALEIGADESATEDYAAAEELFQEAQQLAKDNRIQEARSAAIKAKLRAEDAKSKAKERLSILEAEMEELGR